tara:strand:- start:234 stop:359 length:126 start_codon:yes stop_codon:yes gene_type:complete
LTTKLYNVRFETEGADLFVELEAEADDLLIALLMQESRLFF